MYDFFEKCKSYLEGTNNRTGPILKILYDENVLKESIFKTVVFEPNILKWSRKINLVTYDKNSLAFSIYDLTNQEISSLKLSGIDKQIEDFSYINAHGQIFVIGGEILSNSISTVYTVSETGTYEKASMNSGRCGHRLNYVLRQVGHQKKEYLIVATGAKYPEENSSDTEIYNIMEDKWVNGPNMINSRFHHTSVTVSNQFLYVIAGRHSPNENVSCSQSIRNNSKILDSIEKLDFSKDSLAWEEIKLNSVDGFWTPRDT